MSYAANTTRPMPVPGRGGRRDSYDRSPISSPRSAGSNPVIIIDKKPLFAGSTFTCPTAESKKRGWRHAAQTSMNKSQEELSKLAKRRFNGPKDVTDDTPFDSLPVEAQARVDDWLYIKNDREKDWEHYEWQIATIKEKTKGGGLFGNGQKAIDVVIKRTLRADLRESARSHRRRSSGGSNGRRPRTRSLDGDFGGHGGRHQPSGNGRGSADDMMGGRPGGNGMAGGRGNLPQNGRPDMGGMGGRPPMQGGMGGMGGMAGMGGHMPQGPRPGMGPGMNGPGAGPGFNGPPPPPQHPGHPPMGGMPHGNVQIVDSDSESDDGPPMPMPNGPRPGMGPMPNAGMPMGGRPPMAGGMPPGFPSGVPPQFAGPQMNPNGMRMPQGMQPGPGMNPNMAGMPRGQPMGNMGGMNGHPQQGPQGMHGPGVGAHGPHGPQGGMRMPPEVPFAPGAGPVPNPMQMNGNMKHPMGNGPHPMKPNMGNVKGQKLGGGKKDRVPVEVHQVFSDDESVISSSSGDCTVRTPITSSSFGEEVPRGQRYKTSHRPTASGDGRIYREHTRRRRSTERRDRRPSDSGYVFIEPNRPKLGRTATSPIRAKPNVTGPTVLRRGSRGSLDDDALHERDHRDSMRQYAAERDRRERDIERIKNEIRADQLREKDREVEAAIRERIERRHHAKLEEIDRKLNRLALEERDDRQGNYARGPGARYGTAKRDSFRDTRDHPRDRDARDARDGFRDGVFRDSPRRDTFRESDIFGDLGGRSPVDDDLRSRWSGSHGRAPRYERRSRDEDLLRERDRDRDYDRYGRNGRF